MRRLLFPHPGRSLLGCLLASASCAPAPVLPTVHVAAPPDVSVTTGEPGPPQAERAPEPSTIAYEDMVPFMNAVANGGHVVQPDSWGVGEGYEGGPGRGSIAHLQIVVASGKYPVGAARSALQGPERSVQFLGCYERAREGGAVRGRFHVKATLLVDGEGAIVQAKLDADRSATALLDCLRFFYTHASVAQPERALPRIVLIHEFELRPPR